MAKMEASNAALTDATGLSVCCLTRHDPAMVARMLAALRNVANDIVVAVDSRVDPQRLAPLMEVANTLVRFEYIDPPERARPWLVSLCRNQSVLMIDGDEVPSVALLKQLPALVADDSVVQFRLARCWCFPDERHWLAERPWWPDYQRRLVRCGPHLDFDLQVHGGVRDALPARYVDEPLYHLACLLGSREERLQRAREYELQRPGLVAVGGGAMNETLYAPEDFATLPPEMIPVDDIQLIQAVLSAAKTPFSQHGKTPAVPLISAREVASHVPADALAAQGYRARLTIVERDRRTAPGNNTYIVVEVANDGSAPILRQDSRGAQVRLAARLVNAETGAGIVDWALTPLPCDIPAGEVRLMEALVRIPSDAGRYLMEVDLINERSRWFGCIAHAELLVATRSDRNSL